MPCSTKSILLPLMFSITLALMIFACTGSTEKTESEAKYIEGNIVEGGKSGFRMKDDKGNIMRFGHRNSIEYQPSEFHAYYGDRVGVTFYSTIKGNKESHKASKISLIKTNPNRIHFNTGAFNGIVRARGVMRSLVHWPEKDLTIAFYKKGSTKYSPNDWRPETGSQAKFIYSVSAQRFYKILYYNQINMIRDGLTTIQDRTETGIIKEILVHRSAKKAPDRFTFKLENGDTLTLYGGGETELVPKDLKVEKGNSYSIRFYRLLMGDQSLRHVATKIEKTK